MEAKQLLPDEKRDMRKEKTKPKMLHTICQRGLHGVREILAAREQYTYFEESREFIYQCDLRD
jgi:hypothetical protein